jgi:hypothetical protein
LARGDDISILGLVDDPVRCWIIAMTEDVIRVHFMLKDDTRQKIHEAIDGGSKTSWEIEMRRSKQQQPK